MSKSPLRYPGGKAKFSGYFADILKKKDIQSPMFVEPYCGGAGAAIKLLLSGMVGKIYLNDIDRSIYAFWHSVRNENERLVRKIMKTLITLDEFDKQKVIQSKKDSVDLFTLGFSTLFLNRTTFSGIISGGPIGGRKQSGAYLLDCRFNRREIARRVQRIGEYKKQIRIFNKDAEDFLNLSTINNLPKERAIFYVDPPYVEKGPSLYLSIYTLEDHAKIEKLLRGCDKHVYVSYDDCKEIREIYSKWSKQKVVVPHHAGQFKMGKEVILSMQ
ncbi:MAG: DNA adenine methylase [Candidatus Kaiserbacteria bacterium]|nr:DNA adenine methylase [Candidatus Kaiserbacteria bacterium]